MKSKAEASGESNNSSGGKQKRWEGRLSVLPVPQAAVAEVMVGPRCRLESAFAFKHSRSQAGPDQQQHRRAFSCSRDIT